MIKKIKSIGNLAVFKDFKWDKEVHDTNGNALGFQAINIIYGRNYSGKTTLSRILRALETGTLSDKFEGPSFTVAFSDGADITEKNLKSHGEKIRVFNEDFVKDNLRFITNPEDSIEPFAILGDDNNKIEKEIETLETELGSNEEGSRTGLYSDRINAQLNYSSLETEHKTLTNNLDKQLADKATDRKIGIKYKPERFGDQNYNIQKLKSDIETVQKETYQPPTDDQLEPFETLILEKPLPSIPPFTIPGLNAPGLTDKTELLVTKPINVSNKIELLLRDHALNQWVKDGLKHHKENHKKCAFCDNPITVERWEALAKHFDEESKKLENDIDELIEQIAKEKQIVTSALAIDKNHFYSKFHESIDELDRNLESAVQKYNRSMERLTSQLMDRKKDLLNPHTFQRPDDATTDLNTTWNAYVEIKNNSDAYSSSLNSEQVEAKKSLRLKNVSDYIQEIRYKEQVSSIEESKKKEDEAKREKHRIIQIIRDKEELIAAKKRELNDEEKGARRVNEYLNNFFGHQFLSLEAIKDEKIGEESKRIRFEVIRDGKKAYHLSEGERSLLAFCYFLAKLHDIDTKGSEPIIWIDDPISSLDGNHIFFVYSLLNTEIVSSGTFKQLFISTHNLNFLKYLKRLSGKYVDPDGNKKDYHKGYFVVIRNDKISTISAMPKYLKEYVTEFNYLFHQIYKCSVIDVVDDTNYMTFYNFANNARKFFEIYLYYKYPDQGMSESTLTLFFGNEKIPAILTDRINNEYSHLSGIFERGSTPVEVPEMQKSAKQIIERLKEDEDQFSALLKSIGEPLGAEPQTTPASGQK